MCARAALCLFPLSATHLGLVSLRTRVRVRVWVCVCVRMCAVRMCAYVGVAAKQIRGINMCVITRLKEGYSEVETTTTTTGHREIEH